MNTLAVTNSSLTGTIYFRIYGYGASNPNGTWRLDNLNVQGTVDVTAIGAGWYIDSIAIDDTACCGQ